MSTWRWIRGCGAVAIASLIGCSGQGQSESAEQHEPSAIVGDNGPMPGQPQPGWGGMMPDGGMMGWDAGLVFEGGMMFDGGMIVGDAGLMLDGGWMSDAGVKPGPGAGSSCKPNSAALTPASDLRGSLTGLLVEHVGLLAIVARAGVPELEKSHGTSVIDQNTVALTDIVREAWGPARASEFRSLWRILVQQMLNYAEAVRSGNNSVAADALDAMQPTVDQIAAWAGQTDPGLAGPEFKTSLLENVQRTSAVVEAAATRNPSLFSRLEVAGKQMTQTATALSQAIITSHPQQYPGQFQAPPADLRSALSLLLVGHSYVAWLRTDASASADDKAEGKKSADKANAGLSQLIKALGGPTRSATFSKLWKQHSNQIEQYGAAIASGDDDAAMALREPMRVTTSEIVKLLAAISPGADQGALFTEFEHHEASVISAMQARVESDASQFRAVRKAGQDAMVLSKWLSGELTASPPAEPGLPPLQQ